MATRSRPRRILRAAVLAAVASAALPRAAEARSFRVDEIPNGRLRSCQNCHATSGGVIFNPFGSDVRAHLVGDGAISQRSVDWAALAPLDSDGDGVTNGAELGDPDGTWRIGDPSPPGQTSAPGDPTNATAAGGCGDGVLAPAETCDGDELRGATCENQFLGQGTMQCGLDCRLDTTLCDRSTAPEEDEEAAAPADDGGCAVGGGGASLASWLALALVALRRARTRAASRP